MTDKPDKTDKQLNQHMETIVSAISGMLQGAVHERDEDVYFGMVAFRLKEGTRINYATNCPHNEQVATRFMAMLQSWEAELSEKFAANGKLDS